MNNRGILLQPVVLIEKRYRTGISGVDIVAGAGEVELCEKNTVIRFRGVHSNGLAEIRFI